MKNISRKMELKGLKNTRDLGGIVATNGHKIKSGRLIRSGNLSNLNTADYDALHDILGLVIDIRTDMEINEAPDSRWDDVDYEKIALVSDLTLGISQEKEAMQKMQKKFMGDPEFSLKYMCRTYAAFTDEMAVSGFRKFFELIKQERKKAVLWHCTVGKDRVGVTTALLLKILGVSDEDIMEDYLYTNECVKDDFVKIVKQVNPFPDIEFNVSEETMTNLFGVCKEYLETFWKSIDEEFGSFDNFVKEGLKLSDHDVSMLREIYLE